MYQYAFDIECLGFESTCVVLSAAIIKFKLGEDFPGLDKKEIYEKYMERSLFVKFNVEEQFKKFHRSSSKDVLDWWKQQERHSREVSFIPNSKFDVSASDGIEKISEYVYKHDEALPEKQTIFWQRGSLDQVCFDSLCRSAGKEPILPYNNWMDVRTAINISKNTAKTGYCQILGFDITQVLKHDPVHDCAYDIMMLNYGE